MLNVLAKELSKIVINRRPHIYIISLFLSKGDNLHVQVFTNLINSKLIPKLVSSDKSVFLCFNATQVWPILIIITIM